MKANVGVKDRVTRIVLGLVLLWVGVFGPVPWGWRLVSLVAGATALATGLMRFCPIWAAFRINTIRK
ncbi:MAG TPA: DUF2892 domain-containing protein [Nitrospiria bacterium]